MSDLLLAIQSLSDEEITQFISERKSLDPEESASADYVHHLAKFIRQVTNSTESNPPLIVNYHEITDTILESPNQNYIHAFDEVSFCHSEINCKISFIAIANTEVGLLDLVTNHHSFAMNYCLELPESLSGSFIGWHKDFILDLAESRPRHGLPEVNLGFECDYFKFYTDDAPNFELILSAELIVLIRSLVNFQPPGSVDFSFKNNKLSVLARSVPGPFGLSFNGQQAVFSQIQDDLLQINEQVTILRKIADLLA